MRHSEDLGISADTASWLFFYNGLSSAVGRVLVGIVDDIKHFFVPMLFLSGLVMAGISTLMLPLATSYTSLVVYMVVFGVAESCIGTNINLLILSSLSDRNKAQGFGMFHFVVAFGVALGPPLGGMYCFRYSCRVNINFTNNSSGGGCGSSSRSRSRSSSSSRSSYMVVVM